MASARKAGAQAARKAMNVFRTLQNGSTPGTGVEMASLVEALPYFHLGQLVDCANHFGQRGRVVGPVAAEVAAEIGRRLRAAEPGDGLVDMARNLSAKEVTSSFYGFSKLSPQLPEYQAFYDAVAEGLVQGRWQLQGLRAALMATALADTETGLSDALPAVVEPLLRRLTDSLEARDEISMDELRFLVHAAVRLPPLEAQVIEALAQCTERVLTSASFSVQAHLAVSWLRLQPPASAKRVHLETIASCCKMLATHSRSHYPAHPLPREGLAPALRALLAREAEQTAPALTPPALQSITRGLVQISWGLQRYQWGENPSRSLGIDDWTELLELVFGFCEAHAGGQGRSRAPLWAREALYHVLWRAQQKRRQEVEQSCELSSLLSLLRLLKQHRPSPPADDEFFRWAERNLRRHQDADAVELMTVVSELMPFLGDGQRASVARLVMRPAPAQAAAPAGKAPRQRLLAEAHAAHAAPVVLESAVEKPKLAKAPSRLWGLLAKAPDLAAPEAPKEIKEVEAMEEVEMVRAMEETSSAPNAAVEELQRMLQSALQRVEALEARLEDQERGAKAQDELQRRLDDASNKSDGGNWLAGILSAPEQLQPSAAAMTLHLRQSFSFEQFRRAQSARLRAERLRVAVAPDHFPLWPVALKK